MGRVSFQMRNPPEIYLEPQETTLPQNLELNLDMAYRKKGRNQPPLASSEVLGVYSLIGALNPQDLNIYEAEIRYRHVRRGRKPKLDSPGAVYHYLGDVCLRFPVNETFWVIMLDRKQYAIARNLCTTGILHTSLAHPREVFRPAILCNASSIVIAHNHPSGDPTPSAADIQITRQLREASKTVDIPILDHVIMGNRDDDPNRKGFYSFREAGLV